MTHRTMGTAMGLLVCYLAGLLPAAGNVYTLEQCIQLGLAQSTRARRARLGEDIARVEVRQARSLALPHLSMDAGYTRPGEVQRIEFGDEDWPLGPRNHYSMGAGVTQLLYHGGQVGAALRAADLARDHADAERRATEAELIRDIEFGYYGLLLAEEAVAVQAAAVEQLRAVFEQTQERQAHGAASEFDLLTARVRFANEQPKLIEARNELDLAQAAFSTLLNQPGEIAVTGSFERVVAELSREEAEALALRLRPDAHGSKIRLGLGREAVTSASAEGFPRVEAFFNYRGSNAEMLGAGGEDWDWRWDAGLALRWNFWDGDLTRQTVRRKRLELEQLRLLDESVREGIVLEVRQALLRLAHARESLASGRDTVALAERALEIARARLAAGLATHLEFSEANLALSTARLAWARARHDHAVAGVWLDYACGLSQDGGRR